MSLYEDLPPTKDGIGGSTSSTTNSGSTNSASTGNKSADPTDQPKTTVAPVIKPMMLPRAAQIAKKGITSTSEIKKPIQAIKKTPKVDAPPKPIETAPIPTINTQQNPHDTLFTVALAQTVDAYDPSKPNDYFEYQEERKKALAKMKEEEILKARQALEQSKQNVMETDDDDDADGVPINIPAKPSIGPPAGLTPAEKMMFSMGWKGSGHGLGKQGQGIKAPLVAEKNEYGAAVIKVGEVDNRHRYEPIARSRVLLLQNMVDRGEVDPMLAPETASECQKFGKVVDCKVFENPDLTIPSEDSVRIFVKFDRHEEAVKGMSALNGRWFGGKQVRATLYDEKRFAEKDYRA
eukprot:TRINITY_DN4306_c0_g1_i1.p1 TRINITY_DN4306_c0_g1~~TRINITY_DN4306_c0_g1_i1.p1  ORF type:complete len:359 (-),score=51.46 TRINITY_DN4306_c0_g1_i1:24-1070(-)